MKKLIVIMIIPVFIFACTLTNASAAHVAATPRADPPRVAVPDPVLAGLPIFPLPPLHPLARSLPPCSTFAGVQMSHAV